MAEKFSSAGADNMRSWDRVKPVERYLQGTQVFRTVRGVKAAKKRRFNATFTADIISANLRVSDGNNK